METDNNGDLCKVVVKDSRRMTRLRTLKRKPIEGPINFDALRLLVRSFYDIQKLRISYVLRLQDLDRRQIISKDLAEEYYGLPFQHLEGAEAELLRTVADMVAGHPFAVWAMQVRGIAETLAGAFLAEVGADRQVRIAPSGDLADLAATAGICHETWLTHPDRIPLAKGTSRNRDGKDQEPEEDSETEDLGKSVDARDRFYAKLSKLWHGNKREMVGILEERRGIACFPTVSTLWAYSGLHVVQDPKSGLMVAPRRRKGEKLRVNSFLQTLAYKMSDSWIKCGGYFRVVYDREKARQLATGLPKWHADMRARRKASKLFFALAWEVWRKAEGFPTRVGYCFEKLGHTDQVRPEEVIEK